jgi:hypothetical protein
VLAFGTSDGDLGLVLIEEMFEKRVEDVQVADIQVFTSIKAH